MGVMQATSPAMGKIQVEEQVFIHYRHYADVMADTCLVLVHSLAMDGEFWRLVAPELARRIPVVCVDVRGHGQSSKPQGPYSIQLFAQDVKKVVRELGYEKAVIGGASMGGCISLQFAIENPGLTAALALIDTTSWYGPTAPQDWSQRAQKARSEGFSSMVQFQTTRWFSDAFRQQELGLVQECIDVFVANDVAAYEQTCLAMGAFDAHEQMEGISVPTAIVVGSEDYAAPVEMSEHMHRRISNSTLRVIEGARHLTPLETPSVIVAALNSLLDQVQDA